MKKKLKITKQLHALGQAELCYPLDIFSISRAIANLKDATYCSDLVKEYGDHENAFVRRCLLIALRFSGEFAPHVVEEHSAYISKSLSDPNDWVAYDACWIIKDYGFGYDANYSKLKELAGSLFESSDLDIDKFKPSAARDYAAKMAVEAIRAQQSRTPKPTSPAP